MTLRTYRLDQEITDRPGIQRIEFIADEFGIPHDWAMRKKKQYVAGRMSQIRRQIQENKRQQETSRAIGRAQQISNVTVYSTNLEVDILIRHENGLKQQFRAYKTYLEYLHRPPKADVVTEDMIERAREYLVRDILDVDSKRINCPICDKPRALVRETAVSCFRCRKRYDSIALVMHLRGLTFIEAVKQLQ